MMKRKMFKKKIESIELIALQLENVADRVFCEHFELRTQHARNTSPERVQSRRRECERERERSCTSAKYTNFNRLPFVRSRGPKFEPLNFAAGRNMSKEITLHECVVWRISCVYRFTSI